MRIFTILLAVFQIALSFDDAETFNKTFSRDILIGLATASYQIEGGWDADGKGESVWDRFVHTHPEAIVDGSTGDVAADSYHKVREDVQNLRDIGAQIYRFSISWSRVLPTGLPNNVNQRGVEYYDTLIRLLRAYDIEPVVTMFHWDLPQYLQDLGGWLNPHIVEYFREYARLLYENYGDRVTYWLTFNEPQQFCLNGYGNFTFAPGLVGLSGIADYQCAHNVLKSHAAAYHLYDDEYREKQNGRVGMAIPAGYSFTTDDDPKNIEAAERNMAFDFGWFTNPIFSEEGNYPQVMIDRIGNRSKLEGFTKSRLPEFTQEEIEYIKGTADFFGLNHYTSCVVSYIEDYGIGEYNFYTDKSTNVWLDDSWPTSASEWLRIVPEGFRKMLNWVKDLKDIDIIVTENGVSDTGGTDDDSRIDYFKQYLSAMLQAKYEDNVRVIGYTGWSLLDNFEWVKGYTERFGVYSIDFESESRTRTAKKSAEYLRKVIETRCLLEEGECEPL